ncbi:XrtA/PEP-CTERM system histidine kinase PrsK [Thalassotalea euphylliae]|uniref:histidine kinase n=1 Tax=Thalassotalea euphylliae TaxID=1655234 RepID=A0A3E0U401_9GAMM|nr:XrtA/PEP-CTERM system histidine kinase PrsK [Thalassotalea euphylliae]REL31470.1 PEP-CTERM system histidine kinase PrsK [Thalassotalea euphylliae]
MNWVAITGYGAASLAYLVFFFLLIVIRKKSLIAVLIASSVFFTLVATVTGLVQVYFSSSLKPVLLAENIKLLCLVIFLFAARARLITWSQLLQQPWLLKYVVSLIVLSAVTWVLAHHTELGSNSLFLLFLVLNLFVIVLLEQLYRNAESREKWMLWPLVISLGVITVVDFIIFAQASMLDQLDFNFWYARGYVIALGMPFFLVSARRIKDWSVDVFVSREVVFYSSMILIAGGYLLTLSFAGYALKLFGGEWGDVLSISFAALGMAVLAALLLTEKLRREVKVFITKHFFANKYDYRIEWLRSIEQIEASESEDSYQTSLKVICSSIDAPGGCLIKKTADHHFNVVSTTNMDMSLDEQVHKNLTAIADFCHKSGWIIDVQEYLFVEDAYQGLSLELTALREANVDLIIPVIHNNEIWGLFMLARGKNQTFLNWEDRDLLFAVTKQLSNFISLNEANSELAESKQFEAFHRMSAFLVHDLKNIQGQLALINSNVAKHRDNPAFVDDVFETVLSATERLDKVLQQLRNKQQSEHKNQNIMLSSLIDKVIAQRNLNKPSVDVQIDGELNIEINEELSPVLNHIVQNAQEATDDNGWVKVQITSKNNNVEITVSDNGVGMSESFIKHRLFKPFDTTKGNAGMGIGVFEAKQFVESQGGAISVTSEEHKGSTFILNIPCA